MSSPPPTTLKPKYKDKSTTKPPAASIETTTVPSNLIPLLIAALGPNSFNMASYKKMADMDVFGRTVNSYEHWFRVQKEKARVLLKEHDGDEGKGEGVSSLTLFLYIYVHFGYWVR